jgi:ornithine--oxo-acid transaminase
MMLTQDYIHLDETYGAHNYKPLNVVLTQGQGVWVTDVEGRRYLDCLSAYSAVNQGHCHPRIVQALIAQAQTLTLTSRAFRNDQMGLFLQDLTRVTGYEMALLMNTGAEAVETAVKMARKWGYQRREVPENQAEIIVCADNFHGRTISIISFSTEPQYRAGFGPFTPGFKVVPFGDLRSLEAAFSANTVAFLVEPIQGESGVHIPPAGYLKWAKALCEEHEVLFIADEIQSGLGRSGKLFACDYENVKPDVMIIGKALSGGCYPVSAVLASADILSVFRPGDHGSTYGGNPLACAVAREALKVLVEENLIENSARMGDYFQAKLRAIASPFVQEVRGKGLFIGVELKREAGGARRFCEALMRQGLLCKETHEHVIRFAPPLVISRAEIDWALARIAPVLMGQFEGAPALTPA